MPKFLDVPTWYDDAGIERGCNDIKTLYLGADPGFGAINVICDQNTISDSKRAWVVGESTGGPYGLCYYGTNGPTWTLGPVTPGSVLQYNGSGLSWGAINLYRHSGYITYGSSSGSGSVYYRICYSYVSQYSTDASSFSSFVSNLRNSGFTSSSSALPVSGIYRSAAGSSYSTPISIYSTSSTQLSVEHFTDTEVLSTENITSASFRNIGETVIEIT